jgi:hypothetical protein
VLAVVPIPMLAALRRYLIVAPRPFSAAALAVHLRLSILVPRPTPVAPSRHLIVEPRPKSAAPLVVRRRYLIVAPRPLPAATLVVSRKYLIAVPRPFPAAPLVVRHRNLIAVPGPAAPRRSLQFAKASSATTLPQQEKNSSADVQRGGFIPRGDVPYRRRRLFEPQLRRLRLWQKIWA